MSDKEIIKEESVEIEEVEQSQEEEISFDGLDEQEKIMAEKQGVKESEHKEQPKPEPKEDSQEKKEVIETPSFEEVEQDEKKLDKYNKNEKALYWKWKTDKHKRQELQKELAEIKKQADELKSSSVYKNKVEKIQRLLKEDADGLTIEALNNIILEKEEVKPEIDSSSISIQDKVKTKAMFAEKIGSAKYENFEAISNLAGEIIKNDKTGTYQKIVDDAFTNDNIDENMLVETIVNIARLNPKISDVSSPKKEETIEVKPSKKISSAAISAGGGKRTVSYANLTKEDAQKLSIKEWSKLPEEVRQRILRET